MGRTRLDVLLASRGLFDSRERAKSMIMSGIVFINGQRADKPGTQMRGDEQIEIRGAPQRFVSRGGFKLLKALEYFNVSVAGKTCLDAGASTGGFTDCLLQNGAMKVYAVDVGYGQLDYTIRRNSKVVTLERTNIRYITKEQVPESIELAVIDVSFISLILVIPAVKELLQEDGIVLCLIKPQFEAGREKVGKKGVVRDSQTHKEVLDRFLGYTRDMGFKVLGLTHSPIRGPEGNIEFLGYIKLLGESEDIDTGQVVKDSHFELSDIRL